MPPDRNGTWITDVFRGWALSESPSVISSGAAVSYPETRLSERVLLLEIIAIVRIPFRFVWGQILSQSRRGRRGDVLFCFSLRGRKAKTPSDRKCDFPCICEAALFQNPPLRDSGKKIPSLRTLRLCVRIAIGKLGSRYASNGTYSWQQL